MPFVLSAGASIDIVRFDRFRKEVQCAGVGSIGLRLTVDGTLARFPDRKPMGYPYHNNIRLFGSTVEREINCLLYSDGLHPLSREKAESLLFAGH